ncbi:ATP-binding protein [Desulfonatronum parangueonense]
MPFIANRFHFGITKKLLAWCLVLITIFYVITIYLFLGIRDVVATSERIVDEDFAMIALTEEIMDTLLMYLENMRKYEILGREEYMTASQEHLSRLITLTTSRHNQRSGFSPGLSDLRVSLASFDIDENISSMPDEEIIASWIDTVSRDRLHYLDQINRRVQGIYARGAEAQKRGLLGLVAVTFFGVAASSGIALYLNRSLREIRRGIIRISKDEAFQPIRIRSSDELGELAKAFNEMGTRLRAEEQMRAEFITMLSHEIRTPLTSIRESISLVQEGILGEVRPRQAAYLDIAQNESRRLSDLLTRLMQISYLGSNRLELNLQSISLQDLVAESIQRIRPVADKKNIATRIHSPHSLVTVLADKDHIQQVLFNLLGNAVKFAPPDSTVYVCVTYPDKPQMAQICVTDQGPGIPKDEIQYVFQRYYRGKDAKQITDGAGLGLSISRHIIEAHHGRIWLDCSSFKGSTFCFTLPLATQNRKDQEHAST